MSDEKVLITAALPYANGALHFGHFAGCYLPADIYARFERLCGKEVLFLCGSDEYGVAITLSAEAAGRSPQEHVDHFHAINEDLFRRLGISVDCFSRTTVDGHAETTVQFFEDLNRKGFIEQRETQQLFSPQDQRFLADRYVVGTCPKCGYEQARGDECPKCGGSFEATDLKHPRSKTSGASLELRPTTHWYLRFDLFKEQLQEWLSSKPWKSNVLNFVKHYVDELKPRAITRDLSWGIPVPLPEAQGKVFYVWFDAPIGYISAAKDWARRIGKPDAWKDFWLDPDARLVQFLGKDNIPFHAVFFPAMCMGQDMPLKLVDELPANEFYHLEGRQFSKSEGWMIDVEDFLKHYSVDQGRYMLTATAPETADSEFTWREFQARCNAELLGKFGNLAQRALAFAQQHCNGKVPPAMSMEPIDTDFVHRCEQIVADIHRAYSQFRARQASQLVMELASAGNVYFDAKKPWQAAKSGDQTAVCTTIACCLECLKLLALTSSPILPETAQKLWESLGMQGRLADQRWADVVARELPLGQALPAPQHLFRRIEDAEILQETQRLQESLAKAQKPPASSPVAPASAPAVAVAEGEQAACPPLRAAISYDQFMTVDLRAAQVIACEPVPKSKKLLKLQLDLGFEKRQVVSGIAQFYTAEQMVGKKVVVVANLAPAKLMGVESHGMILAVTTPSGALELVEVPGATLGEEVR
jgi:methionyl-tRNA synthetase